MEKLRQFIDCSIEVISGSMILSDVDGFVLGLFVKHRQYIAHEGIGKPEVLVEDLSSFWSRRIDATKQLAYAVTGSHLTIIFCRYHYL